MTFSATNYNFGEADVGDVVPLTFFFTNTGAGTLVVSNVVGSGGCVTAGDWSREVAPGQAGSIPMQVITKALAAGAKAMAVTVTSNDKSRPVAHLQVTGALVKAIEITPTNAFFQCSPDLPNATMTVLIVNKTDRPLVLSDPKSSHPALKAELQTTVPGKEFRLVLSTVQPLPQESVALLVTVQTSFTSTPSLTVPAFISIVPAISVIPPEISLPPAPLAKSLTVQINFINNGPNALTLSNALVNTKEAKVSLKEVKPGKQFQATVAFPEGFAPDPGQPLELSVNSSDPRHPLLKVAVRQMARSLAAPAGPAGKVAP